MLLATLLLARPVHGGAADFSPLPRPLLSGEDGTRRAANSNTTEVPRNAPIEERNKGERQPRAAENLIKQFVERIGPDASR